VFRVIAVTEHSQKCRGPNYGPQFRYPGDMPVRYAID
jgi:hypothetical protein